MHFNISSLHRLIVTLTFGISAMATAADTARVISVDGITTEIIFALGAGDQLIARDSGSTYPEAATKLPDIGMGHQINPESILKMKPTLIIGRDRPMSKPGFQILEAAGAKTLRLSGDTGVDAAKENIRTLAKEFGKVEEGEKLIASIEADLAQVKKKLDALKDEDAPKVMVVYVRPNATMLMGDDANATALAHLAGATSAFPGMMGNKPLNAEAVIGAKPDVVLCYAQGLESVGGIDTLLKQPGIAGTPAGNQRRVVALDDLLIGGFGPRTGKAVLELFHALYETEGEYIPAREK